MTIKIGDSAPNFLLPDQNGTFFELTALKGKIIVLYFYPKDDTSGCTIQAKDFSCMVADFAEANAIVIGMSPDGTKSHAKFTNKHDLKITIISDEEKMVLNTYGVWVEKSMYGKKSMGVERSTFLIGADGTIKNMWRKVSAAGHAELVLNAVKAL